MPKMQVLTMPVTIRDRMMDRYIKIPEAIAGTLTSVKEEVLSLREKYNLTYFYADCKLFLQINRKTVTTVVRTLSGYAICAAERTCGFVL